MDNQFNPSSETPIKYGLFGRRNPSQVNGKINISVIRESFFKTYDENIHKFHVNDVERIKTEDLFVQRFIDGAMFTNSNKICIQDVIDLMLNILKWRQEYGINELSAKDFAHESTYCGMLKQATLSNGDILMCILSRKFKKVDEWTEHVFIPGVIWYYETEIVPSLKNGAKLQIAFDLSNCGLDQADSTLLFSGAPILIKNYPGIVSKCYFCNVPWILKPFLSLFLSLVPKRFKDCMNIVDKNSLSDIIGPENVPDFLGGPLTTNNLNMIEGLSDIETIGVEKGFKRANIEKFKRVIQEAKEME